MKKESELESLQEHVLVDTRSRQPRRQPVCVTARPKCPGHPAISVPSSQAACLARTPRLPRLAGATFPRDDCNASVLEMKPTIEATAVISPGVLFQEIGGEAVLLDLASERYFGLDDVGTRIRQLAGAGASARCL